jgi:oligosaccharide repeat unit polymerase
VFPQIRALTPLFSAALVTTALFSVWESSLRGNEGTAAIASGTLLVLSLIFARQILQVPLASGPMVYFVLLGLFHLGLVVPWALGVYDISRTPFFSPRGLSPSIELISYSIIAFDVGLVVSSIVSTKQTRSLHQSATECESAEVCVAGCLLLGAGIVMFIIGVIGLDPLGFFRLTYSETFRLRAESDPRLFGSGITISFIGLSIAVAGASRRRFRIVAAAGAVWLIILLYWGFRGPALIAAIIVYIIAGKKGIQIPRWVSLVAAASFLLVLPAIRTGRESPLNDRFSQISFKDFNILDSPVEMGMSIRPLVETIDLVGPNDFRWGKTYWLGIEGIVPNLALRWEASTTDSVENLPPNHWITAMVDPWTYRNYGGMGFSAVAEPYMNFGVAGVILYFLFLAVFLMWLERLSISNSYALAAWALILGPLLWTTRNDFSNFFRPSVWGLLTLVGVKLLSKAYSKISAKRTPSAAKLTTKLARAANR